MAMGSKSLFFKAFFSLFPAHAGVIPDNQTSSLASKPFPRTRGGDPSTCLINADAEGFSPHTRG